MDVTECENCGGLVVFDADAEAVKCVFCADETLRPVDLQPAVQPTQAVEFGVSAKEAQKAFRSWARRSFWAPRALRDQVPEIEPVWVPAWRVRAHVHATWTGLVKASTKSGKRPRSGADAATREVWVPASLGLTQAELAALAPFPEHDLSAWDPEQAQAPFEVGGLTEEAATRGARPRFRHDVQTELIKRERLRDCRVSVLLEGIEPLPLMLPVYVGCVRFRDQPWRFVINGRTGRVTGRAPLDRRKVAFASVLALLVVLAIVWLS